MQRLKALKVDRVGSCILLVTRRVSEEEVVSLPDALASEEAGVSLLRLANASGYHFQGFSVTEVGAPRLVVGDFRALELSGASKLSRNYLRVPLP